MTARQPRLAVLLGQADAADQHARVRPVPPEPAVQVARVFPVINIAGRLTSAEIAVTPSGLIVVSTPDGGSFAVDPDDQFNQFSAALRAARLEALSAQERTARTPKHREGLPRRD